MLSPLEVLVLYAHCLSQRLGLWWRYPCAWDAQVPEAQESHMEILLDIKPLFCQYCPKWVNIERSLLFDMSLYFSDKHRIRPKAHYVKTLFYPTAFPLVEADGKLSQGQDRAMESKARDDMDPVPSMRVWIITLTNPNVSKPPLQHLFIESSQWFITFLTSALPSSCHIQFQNRINRSSRALWIWDEQSKQRMSLSAISIREWTKER